MSSAKRARRHQAENQSASPPPASKRLKVVDKTHAPPKPGLGFLVDEDARAGKKLQARLSNGVSKSPSNRVDESRAVVAANTAEYNPGKRWGEPNEIIDISSAEESSSMDDDSENDDDDGEIDAQDKGPEDAGNVHSNGHLSASEDEAAHQKAGENSQAIQKVTSSNAELEEDAEMAEEPSFGDLLRARHPDPIDVQASLAADDAAIIPASGNRALAPPSATSLGTVLTQALKTNDKELLESCFRMNDLPSIRYTIQRLQSQHVATLLQRIAERIYKRPGRTGNLMVWIQWSLVAHGGYLASHPEVMRKLKALNEVVRARASGLQPLLHLKGKLDMLSAQLELRRSIQASSRIANPDADDDDENVLYVEGEDDASFNSDDKEGQDVARESKPGRSKARRMSNPSNSDEGGIDDDLPNGVAIEGDDSLDENDEDDDRDGFLNIEAEEGSEEDEEGDEASSEEDANSAQSDSEDDDDLSDEDGSDVDAVQSLNPSKLSRKR